MPEPDPLQPGDRHTLLVGLGIVGAGAAIGLILGALLGGGGSGFALAAGAGAGVVVAAIVLGLRVLRSL